MTKDFKGWHCRKVRVNEAKPPHFHDREIWFAYVGVNVGFEQDGAGDLFVRPVLVLRKFNIDMFWGIPLSTSQKPLSEKTDPFYFDFTFIEGVKSRALLSQMRLIDARRLATRMGYISTEDFPSLMKKLKALLP